MKAHWNKWKYVTLTWENVKKIFKKVKKYKALYFFCLKKRSPKPNEEAKIPQKNLAVMVTSTDAYLK